MNDDEFMSDAQAWSGLENATRREKSRRASHMRDKVVGPSYPTQAQINKVGGLIGSWRPGHIEAFVRYANCYEPGQLTRVHFIHAIDLALNGRNLFGTAEELVAMSADPDMILEPNLGEFQRQMIARKKGMSKRGKPLGNDAHFAPTMRGLEQARAERLRSLVLRVDQARAALHSKPREGEPD